MYGQQHDRLVLTVKYSQSNLCFMAKWITLKIYWWSLKVLYSLTCCWQYINFLRASHRFYPSEKNLWFLTNEDNTCLWFSSEQSINCSLKNSNVQFIIFRVFLVHVTSRYIYFVAARRYTNTLASIPVYLRPDEWRLPRDISMGRKLANIPWPTVNLCKGCYQRTFGFIFWY
jgi:hypothetical protein